MGIIEKLQLVENATFEDMKTILRKNKNIAQSDVVRYEIGEYFLTNSALYMEKKSRVSESLLALLESDVSIPKAVYTIPLSGVKQLINSMSIMAIGQKNVASSIQQQFFQIIFDAAKREVTDVSISYDSTKKLSPIKFRELGEMVEYKSIPSESVKKMFPAIYMMCYGTDSTYSILDYQSGSLRASDLPSEIQATISGIRMQFNPIHPQPSRELVCRIMQRSKGEDNLSLKSLGFNREQEKTLMTSPRGLTLFSGPTGSGKSTALRAILQDFIVKFAGAKKIYTVEDPVEVEIDGAIQLTIANVSDEADRENKTLETLRALTRSDLDFGVIGEIRDINAARYAYQLASSGHPILSTFHAAEANAIPSRLRSLGMEDYQVFDSAILTRLISQRLVPILCTQCLIEIDLDFISGKTNGDFFSYLKTVFDKKNHKLNIRGKGCDECGGRGINGRTAIAEIIETSSEYFKIYSDQGADLAKKYWRGEMKGRDIKKHAIEKVLSGTVDYKSILSGDVIGEFGWFG